jgi:hypothetical protein
MRTGDITMSYIKDQTIRRLVSLSKDEENAFLFDNLGVRDRKMPTKLFEELVKIFADELDVSENDLHKIDYLLRIGFVAGQNFEDNKLRD